MRELTLGIARPSDVFKSWLREISVGAINGFVSGSLLATANAWFWMGNPYLGLVVGLALANNTMIAVSIGCVPLLHKKLEVDLAIASGPILTGVTDMYGFFLVLGIATMMLPLLVS